MAATGGNGAGAGGAPPLLVRPGAAPDAAAVARLHAEQISEGFLSSLGPRFLERLYRRICRTEGSFLLVAESEGALAGFVAGSVALRRLYADFVLRDGVRVMAGSPWRLLSSWRHAAQTLRHGGAPGEGAAASDGELLAIAVDPAHRGRGVGAMLVRALLDDMARRDAHDVDVVVGAGNTAAVALYRGAGFEPLRTFEMHPGTESLVLRHRASGRAPR